tara:strand:- start:187 stop:1758 length:1572 start_codon:yes stop_codon:yes gene_type:complete
MNEKFYSQAWGRLTKLASDTELIRSELLVDKNRFNKFSFSGPNIQIDLSKQIINEEIWAELFNLAKEKKLSEKIRELFEGAPVNQTENKPALHPLLRNSWGKDETNLAVLNNLKQMESLVEEIHSGKWRGYTGKSIQNVVHIGIGGSHLGQEMVLHALEPQPSKLSVFFITNIDHHHVRGVLRGLNPERTIFLIASKSFSTTETLINGNSVIDWFMERTNNQQAASQHFFAITGTDKVEKAKAYGIKESNIFTVPEAVGGRYSLWSTMGLVIAIAIGFHEFENLLKGAASMDDHFQSAPFAANLPVLLALTGIWNINFLNIGTHLILPYSERLSLLPKFLQQLEMESNGKSVDAKGHTMDIDTAPFLWGGTGTDSQHSFHQLLFQGTRSFSSDLILVKPDQHPSKNNRDHWLLANALAQSRAMLIGNDDNTTHKRISGGHGSSIILLDKHDAFSLGSLLSLYEHKVFCQSVIWNINPFDQFGVEFGKQLAPSIYQQLFEDSTLDWDPSTNGLIEQFRRGKQND